MTDQEHKKILKEIEEAYQKIKQEWEALSPEERAKREKESEDTRIWEDLSDFDGWKVTPPTK